MPAIEQQTWQEASLLTWGSLAEHQWMDFRIALLHTDTEQSATGVTVERSSTTATAVASMDVQGVAIRQSPVVMRTRTEMLVNIVVSERDYKGEMIRSLPLYERNSGTFQETLSSYDREFRKNEQDLTIVNRNMFVDTSVESLPIFERDLAIETVDVLKYDQRREQVISRYISAFDQTTEETIKAVAAAYSNGEVDVNSTDVDGVYEIQFVGSKGIPNNMTGLKKALDIIMPAHLVLTYVFTYNNWSFVNGRKWSDVAPLTWDELQIWDGVS